MPIMTTDMSSESVEKMLAGNPWAAQYITQDSTTTFDNGLYTADDGIGFYVSQLAHLETTVYQVPYANITYADDVPVVGGVPETAQNWMYRGYDGVTMAKFIGAKGDDLATVQMNAQSTTVPLGYFGIACEYSLDEMRTSAALNMPIDSNQAQLARRGAEEFMQNLVYFGNAERNMQGLFDHDNVTIATAPDDINNMSGQQLFDLVNDAIFGVWESTNGIHLPDTVLLYPALFKKMSSTLMTGYTDSTVMKIFKEQNYYTLQTGQQLDIKSRFQLSAANLAENGVNNGNKDRFMVYEKNAQNLGYVYNMPFRMNAPQYDNLMVKVPCEAKGSGTEFRLPLSARYVDAA